MIEIMMFAVLFPWYGHDCDMLVPWSCHTIAMIVTCSSRVLPYYCHGLAMLVP
jgi:hypothetical protein